MKKIFFFIIALSLFTSCEDNVQFNTPALQAQKNYSFWRAKDMKVVLNASGQLEITAFSGYETIVMKTQANAVGSYVFGTTNTNNFVTYTLDKLQTTDNIDKVYTSNVVEGPVYTISSVLSSGLNYSNESIVQTTTSGSGSGLRLKVTANSNGNVSSVAIVSRGLGYKAGDIIYLTGGNNNAAVQVVNTQQSNGVITIEKIENGTYSGTFNFNVVDSTGDVIAYTDGIFYKVPLRAQ